MPAAGAALIFAVNRPHRRIMHKGAPQSSEFLGLLDRCSDCFRHTGSPLRLGIELYQLQALIAYPSTRRVSQKWLISRFGIGWPAAASSDILWSMTRRQMLAAPLAA